MSDGAKPTRSEAVEKMLIDLSCMDLTTEDADDLVSMVRSRGGRVSFYENEHDRDDSDASPCRRCGKPAKTRARPYFGRKFVSRVPLSPDVPGALALDEAERMFAEQRVLDAVARLAENGVPAIDGAYWFALAPTVPTPLAAFEATTPAQRQVAASLRGKVLPGHRVLFIEPPAAEEPQSQDEFRR